MIILLGSAFFEYMINKHAKDLILILMVYMKRQLQLTLSIINYNKRIMNGTTACMSIDSLKLEHWYRSSYLTYIYTDEHKINVKIGRVYKYIIIYKFSTIVQTYFSILSFLN